MSPRILIVTSGHLCRHPRPLKEARALTAAGYQVTVLGVRNHAASEARDAVLLAGDGFRRINVDLLQGKAATFLRLWGRVARTASAHWHLHTVAALGATGPLTARARREAADLTIVHTEAGLAVGADLLRRGRRVAADLEDWHSEDLLPEIRRQRPLRLLRRLERTLLRAGLHTTTTSEALAEALHHAYGGARAHVITNSFPLQPRPEARPAGRPARLVWFSQTIGPGRGLEPFLSAWGEARMDSELTMIGEASPAYAAALRTRLPSTHQNRLIIQPPVPTDELPRTLAGFDIGLALEAETPASRNLTITNKILQYLNAGLAVIATPTAGQREVLAAAPGAGWLLPSSPASWRNALPDWLSDTPGLRRCQSEARRLAEQRYCWEVESPRLVRLVAKSLAATP